MKEFKLYHPIILIIYFISIFFFTLLLNNPLSTLISLIISIIFNYLILTNKKFVKLLITLLIFIILITIINTFFVHTGVTVLFFINDNRITLEAIIYGIYSACLLSSIILWFSFFNEIFDTNKIIYLCGSIFPIIGLIISMILRFIPRILKHYKEVKELNKTYYDSNGFKRKIRNNIKNFNAILTYTFENSIDTADIMSAKGYGYTKRSMFHNFKWDLRDTFAFIIVLILALTTFSLYLIYQLDYYFYPEIKVLSNDYYIINIFFIILLIIPIILEMIEVIKWKYLRSKI